MTPLDYLRQIGTTRQKVSDYLVCLSCHNDPTATAVYHPVAQCVTLDIGQVYATPGECIEAHKANRTPIATLWWRDGRIIGPSFDQLPKPFQPRQTA
jgi:hypothetical protein